MIRILHIIKKEFLQFKRDPKMFAIVLIAPVLQLIILGYAATFDINSVHTGVLDRDKTPESRSLIKCFTGSDYFKVDYYTANYEELEHLINKGRITTGLVIPAGFGRKIGRGEIAPFQAIFDASDGNFASISSGYVTSVISGYNKRISAEYKALRGTLNLSIGGVTSETRVWYNPEMKTRNYMLPAIAGLLIMIITIILTSLAVVKEKEIGTLEQLIVTPIKPFQLIIGKLVPFMLMGILVVAIVLNAMVFIFGIPIKGSKFFLYLSTFIFVISTLGMGLFVSTITRTQQQAMMLSIFVIMLPMIYLSGFAFPVENMPAIIQYFTYLIPLRYYITIIRGVITKGLGFQELWFDAAVLLVMGIVIITLSSLRFRKRLE